MKDSGLSVCAACTSKRTGSRCLFIGVRCPLYNVAKERIVSDAEPLFVSYEGPDAEIEPPALGAFSAPLTLDRIAEIKSHVATNLVGILRAELEHAQMDGTIRRKVRYALVTLYDCRTCRTDAYPSPCSDRSRRAAYLRVLSYVVVGRRLLLRNMRQRVLHGLLWSYLPAG
jgi:hypothetical protein